MWCVYRDIVSIRGMRWDYTYTLAVRKLNQRLFSSSVNVQKEWLLSYKNDVRSYISPLPTILNCCLIYFQPKRWTCWSIWLMSGKGSNAKKIPLLKMMGFGSFSTTWPPLDLREAVRYFDQLPVGHIISLAFTLTWAVRTGCKGLIQVRKKA